MNRPCEDGFSKTILCERDNVLRCLKECMPGCSAYRAKAEPGTVVRSQKVVSGASVSGKPSVRSSGGCVDNPVPCGKNATPQEVQNRSW